MSTLGVTKSQWRPNQLTTLMYQTRMDINNSRVTKVINFKSRVKKNYVKTKLSILSTLGVYENKITLNCIKNKI